MFFSSGKKDIPINNGIHHLVDLGYMFLHTMSVVCSSIHQSQWVSDVLRESMGLEVLTVCQTLLLWIAYAQ